jgi:hypothetical protein
MVPDSTRAGPVRFEIDVPPEVPEGEPVAITLRATNTGLQPTDLYLGGRPIAFDVIVARESGEVVWQRLKDKMVPAILQLRTLGPGESLELTERWNQRNNVGQSVGPGRYAVHGTFPTQSRPPAKSPTALLRIVARGG